jgi:hypothetical protein
MRDIVFRLPDDEAMALAQFCFRFAFEDCARYAAITVSYSGRPEADVIWSALLTLQRQLGEAGIAAGKETEAAMAASEFGRLGLDTLATARLQFAALADELPACPHRDALRLAVRIVDSLSSLRTGVSEIIIHLDLGKFDRVDAARELRHAMDAAANEGGDDGIG